MEAQALCNAGAGGHGGLGSQGKRNDLSTNSGKDLNPSLALQLAVPSVDGGGLGASASSMQRLGKEGELWAGGAECGGDWDVTAHSEKDSRVGLQRLKVGEPCPSQGLQSAPHCEPCLPGYLKLLAMFWATLMGKVTAF